MPKLAQVVSEKFQYDLLNDEPLTLAPAGGLISTPPPEVFRR